MSDWTSWLASTTSSSGFSHAWFSTRCNTVSPLRPAVSASAWALGTDTRVRAVSATARKIDSRNRTATTATRTQSVLLIGGCSSSVVELEELPLLGLHHRRLLRVRVVVAEHVEDPVDDEQRDLVVVGAGVGRRVPGRHR